MYNAYIIVYTYIYIYMYIYIYIYYVCVRTHYAHTSAHTHGYSAEGGAVGGVAVNGGSIPLHSII